MNFKETAKAKDGVSIKEKKSVMDKVFEKAVWTIRRFANDADYKANKPYRVSTILGNALVNEGINEAWTILASAASGTKFDNTNAQLIVGTGVGGENPGDTIATFTNGVKVGMDGGYPTYGASQKATWKATFTGLVANQAWNEFGVTNDAVGGTKLLNRKVSAQGTKTAGQTWELTIEITLS